MNDAHTNLAARRRRLLWRATHRGIREMDILLGRFARAHIASMDDGAIEELEAIIALPDQDLLEWIAGQAPVPAEFRSATLDALIAYRP
jgi:antitoxin CptB